MSLILDALRKSEAERRRGQTPDLYASLPPVVASSRPEWLRWWPLLVLAALALAAVLFFAGGRASTEAESESDEVSTPRPEAASATLPPRTATAASAAPTRATAVDQAKPIPPATVTTPAPAMRLSPAAEPTAMQRAEAAAIASAPEVIPSPPAANQSPAQPSPEADTLPPIAVLSAGERASLPPLKLSMHVFASEPDKRFAIIDGQRVTEGATLGPSVVEQIRRDGVVLNINGRRVLLPRP